MPRKNYSKMSKKPMVPEQAVIDEVESVDESVEERLPVIGIVTGCGKLNVRKEPAITSGVVCEAAVNSELLIDLDKSTDEWFSVCTAAGSEGFCMKKFVEVQ